MTFKVPRLMHGQRLDYVIARLCKFARKKARVVVESGAVRINNVKVTFASRRVRESDIVRIGNHKIEEFGQKNHEQMHVREPVKIFHEDHDLLVVDKQPGLLTCKTGREQGESVEEKLRTSGRVVFPVHRLDRETSGVLIFAKTREALDNLNEQFRTRQVKKTYIGVIEGILSRKKGIFKGRLLNGDEYGETLYRLIKLMKNASVVEFLPVTGRTHQIRQQLFMHGYCLVGEKKYLPKRKRTPIDFPRVALHALSIGFRHPGSNKWARYDAPMPDDLEHLIACLTRGRNCG